MAALTAALRALERLGRSRHLEDAARAYDEVQRQLEIG